MTVEEAYKETMCLYASPKYQVPVEAIEIALEALEKLEKKKPNVFQAHPKPVCLCPTCGSVYIKRHDLQMNNCNNCGQAIDWSEEE